MMLPARLRGLGGGGCLLGSVGLSDVAVLTGRRAGGGVAGRGIRCDGGEGDGDGGRGRTRALLCDGDAAFPGTFALLLGTENERDLQNNNCELPKRDAWKFARGNFVITCVYVSYTLNARFDGSSASTRNKNRRSSCLKSWLTGIA